MEQLYIKNFGPIADIRIERLRQFNVFNGESGSGKSTIMKVLAMMRWIFRMACVRTYFKNSGLNSPFRFHIDRILRENGLWSYLRPDSEIHYHNGSYSIIINNGKIHFPKKYVENEELTLHKIAYISDKRVLIPDLAAGNVSLRHNMFYLEETFLNFQKALDVISSTDMSYLGVKMSVKKGSSGRKVYVSSINDKESFDNLPLTSASSGMQSSVALHFIVKYFSKHFDIVNSLNSSIIKYLATNDRLSQFKGATDVGSFPHKRISIHLEEPELSLYPSNQWGIMRYLVGECLTAENSHMDLTLATHSPYILTAINLMILAFRAKDNSIPVLNPDSVGAWNVVDGHIENIFDRELELINGTPLDTISDFFDDLFFKYTSKING